MVKPLSRAEEITLIVEKYRDENADPQFGFHEAGGQIVFKTYGAASGFAPSFVCYIIDTKNPVEPLWESAGEVRINFADSDQMIDTKIKAGFARARGETPPTQKIAAQAKPSRPDYAAALYGR
jgi:hypothetical protein